MPLEYNLIEIFTRESAKWEGKPLWIAVMDFVRGQRVAARTLVYRAMAGSFESGETANYMFEALSMNMPVKIEIILPARELNRVLPKVNEMVVEGLVAVEERKVHYHATRRHFLPRHLKVRDVMTQSPKYVEASTTVDQIVRMLLHAPYTSLPVVDDQRRVLGILSEGDLLHRAGLPVRPGLLVEFEEEKVTGLLATAADMPAADLMSHPAKTVHEEEELRSAVETMVLENLKCVPVTDAEDRLVGVLARGDVFKAIAKELPHGKAMQEMHVEMKDIRLVRDIMQREVHSVTPDASLEEVMEALETQEVHQVAVVEDGGKFLGLISDREVFNAFSEHRPRLWEILGTKLPFFHLSQEHRDLLRQLQARVAADIAEVKVETVREDDSLDRAVGLMNEREMKYIPVLDGEGRFKGMIGRDMVLKAGLRECMTP